MMSKQTAMTAAAVGFAAFAAWFVLRGPGRAAVAPTPSQKRAAEVRGFLGVYDMQQASITTQAPGFYVAPINFNGS